MNSDDRKEIINIVNQGFEAVMLPYFARVQEGIDAIREDVAVIKNTLQDHGNRLAKIEVRQENHSYRLGRIENILDDHSKKLDEHGKKLDDHTHRLGCIEGKLDTVIDRQDMQAAEIKELKNKAG